MSYCITAAVKCETSFLSLNLSSEKLYPVFVSLSKCCIKATTPVSTCSWTFSAVVTFFLCIYCWSNRKRSTLPCGITKAPKAKDSKAIIVAEIIYGRSNLLKLIPVERIAIISELSASLVVKKITEINTNKALKRFAR